MAIHRDYCYVHNSGYFYPLSLFLCQLKMYTKLVIMKLLLSSIIVLSSFGSWSQLNIDSIGHIDYMSEHLTMLNDVWGYVDENGNEYGLIGAEKGTSVVDLSTPSIPTEIFWEPGVESVWRDLKTWDDYAYVTTEALSGLLVIDLSPLPSSLNCSELK